MTAFFRRLINNFMRKDTLYQKIIKMLSRYGFGKIYLIKLIHNFLKVHLRPKFVNIQGHKIFINRKDFYVCSHLLNFGAWEPNETELIKREIKKGDVALDLGAHIGYYTLIFAKLVGEKGRVFAFEPAPDNFALLEKNVKVNNYSNVILERKGVLNKSGKAKLWLRSDSNKSGHRIHPINMKIHHPKPIEIDVVSLDDYFKDYNGKIDFIKLDIEGSEEEALRGMGNILKKNKKIKILAENGKYLKLLKKYNFKFYDIKERRPINISSKKADDTNLLCIKTYNPRGI